MSVETKPKVVARHAIKERSGRRVLTHRQWAEAEAIWASGLMGRRALAEKFGVSETSISKHMTAAGIKRGERAHEHREKVQKELEKAQATEAAIAAERIREATEEHYKMVSGLGKLTWQEVLTAKQEGRPVATALPNLKALETAIGNIKKVREEKWALLGLDKEKEIDDEDLPELVISELTADQVTNLRNQDFGDFEELTVDEVSEDDSDDIAEENEDEEDS